MQGRRVVAVAGTHGKTTTTSLLTVALQHCARGPVLRDRRRAQRVRLQRPRRQRRDLRRGGRRERRRVPRLLAATAPWSPTSRPTTSTTTAPRRPTTRPSPRSWTGSTRPASWSPASTTPAPPTSPSRPATGACAVVGVGESERADLRAEALTFAGATSRFTVVDRGRRLGEVTLQIPGRHYVLDALAALGAGLAPRLRLRRPAPWARGLHRHPPPDGAQGRGRRRPGLRQLRPPPQRDRRRPAGGALAGRGGPGRGRPSSRTSSPARRSSAPRWAQALGAADEVVVMDVYVAREDPEPGVNGGLVAVARAAAARAGALRAVLVARRPRRWSSGPGPATWC